MDDLGVESFVGYGWGSEVESAVESDQLCVV